MIKVILLLNVWNRFFHKVDFQENVFIYREIDDFHTFLIFRKVFESLVYAHSKIISLKCIFFQIYFLSS